MNIGSTEQFNWLITQERIETINKNEPRELPKFVNVTFIFISLENEVVHVDTNNQGILPADASTISVETQQQWINEKIANYRVGSYRKFDFRELLLFTIDIDSTQIAAFNVTEPTFTKPPFFTTTNVLQDIQILPSLFIFHEINSLTYCLYESPVSILKLTPRTGMLHKTKKVRFPH